MWLDEHLGKRLHPASSMENPLHKHGQFFDVWSRFYRLTLFGLELRRIQRKALALLQSQPGQRVLDLGCGPGDGAVALAKTGVDAIGLDYSQGMLDTARKERLVAGRLTRGPAGKWRSIARSARAWAAARVWRSWRRWRS